MSSLFLLACCFLFISAGQATDFLNGQKIFSNSANDIPQSNNRALLASSRRRSKDDTIYDMQVSVKSRETWLHSSAMDFEAIVSNLAEELSGNHQAANVTSYVTAQSWTLKSKLVVSLSTSKRDADKICKRLNDISSKGNIKALRALNGSLLCDSSITITCPSVTTDRRADSRPYYYVLSCSSHNSKTSKNKKHISVPFMCRGCDSEMTNRLQGSGGQQRQLLQTASGGCTSESCRCQSAGGESWGNPGYCPYGSGTVVLCAQTKSIYMINNGTAIQYSPAGFMHTGVPAFKFNVTNCCEQVVNGCPVVAPVNYVYHEPQSISYDCTGTNGWQPATGLSCPVNMVIGSIYSATFGQSTSSGFSCPGQGNPPTSSCTMVNVENQVAQDCIGRNFCSPIFSNISDPCPYTIKFMDTRYVCITQGGGDEVADATVCDSEPCQTTFGDNGSVSCETYCNGIDGAPWNGELPSGWNGATCVSTSDPSISCTDIPGVSNPVYCVCTPSGLGWAQSPTSGNPSAGPLGPNPYFGGLLASPSSMSGPAVLWSKNGLYVMTFDQTTGTLAVMQGTSPFNLNSMTTTRWNNTVCTVSWGSMPSEVGSFQCTGSWPAGSPACGPLGLTSQAVSNTACTNNLLPSGIGQTLLVFTTDGVLQVINPTDGTIYWSSATCGYTERFVTNPDPPGLPPFCPNGGTCDGDCPNCECKGGSDIKAGYHDDYDVKGNTCWTNRNPGFYSFYSNLQDGTWESDCTNYILYTGPGPYFLYLSDTGSLTINNTYNTNVWTPSYDVFINPYLTVPDPVDASSSAPEPNVCPFQWPTNAPATVACASSSSTPTSYLAVSTETDSLSMREFSQSGYAIAGGPSPTIVLPSNWCSNDSTVASCSLSNPISGVPAANSSTTVAIQQVMIRAYGSGPGMGPCLELGSGWWPLSSVGADTYSCAQASAFNIYFNDDISESGITFVNFDPIGANGANCLSINEITASLEVPEVCQPTASTAQQFFLSALGTSPGGNPSSICGIPQNYQWVSIQSPAMPGMCLSAESYTTPPTMLPCNLSETTQWWSFIPVITGAVYIPGTLAKFSDPQIISKLQVAFLNATRHPSGVIDGPQGTQTFPTSLDSSAGSAVAATAIIKFEGYNAGGSGATSQWQLSDEMVLRYYLATMSSYLNENDNAIPLNVQLQLTPCTQPADGGAPVSYVLWVNITLDVIPPPSSCSNGGSAESISNWASTLGYVLEGVDAVLEGFYLSAVGDGLAFLGFGMNLNDAKCTSDNK